MNSRSVLKVLKIIDSHLHLWDVAEFRYPICASNQKLNRSFSAFDYRSAAEELPADVEIDGAVLVEAGVNQASMRDQTRWALAQALDPANPVIAVIAACRLEDDNFHAWLEEFAGHSCLSGVRRALHAEPDDLSRSQRFVENVRSLAQLSLPFDLCVLARQLPIACELVRQCPAVNFVLDHCGLPDIRRKALDPWRSHLRELASLPNVVGCKISGLLTCADHDARTFDDLRPFVDYTIDCFGAARVMFGSDWPVCTQAGSLAGWVQVLRRMTIGLSASEGDSFFRGNAIRTYRLRLRIRTHR